LTDEEPTSKTISLKLPSRQVSLIDQLKREYGVRSRGQVLEILLEGILGDVEEDESKSPDHRSVTTAAVDANVSTEVTSLVLIESLTEHHQQQAEPAPVSTTAGGIDLPGFVSRRTNQLRDTLQTPKRSPSSNDTPLLSSVALEDLQAAAQAADDHWSSLYGQAPGQTVVEAAMLWLARDLWSNLDASEGRAFTWSAANAAMEELCADWKAEPPSLGRVMVVAGTLEDPFATAGLSERMPTLVRRFVNRFRRSRQVTSFETLESTMTVHGALKLLGLSTQAGASVTITSIREAYKNQARAAHPDSGGSTDSMRRLNEAYRLLRELYRQ
jgi:hypothetical protein